MADRERLRAAIEAARTAWPQIALDEEIFAARVGDAPIEGPRAADLWLACACAEGDPAAIAALEAGPFAAAAATISRMRLPPDVVTEAKQLARVLVLVGVGDRPPAIRDYAGRGDLRGWLRIILVREALRLAGDAARTVPIRTSEMAELPAVADDPETRFLKQRYKEEFRDAFVAALSSLSPPERGLLRYHLVERLTIDDLAILSRVHRATAARRLADARETLLARTRDHLRRRLQVGESDLQSILRLIESQMAESVSRLLAEA